MAERMTPRLLDTLPSLTAGLATAWVTVLIGMLIYGWSTKAISALLVASLVSVVIASIVVATEPNL